jgi:hypothetical protein
LELGKITGDPVTTPIYFPRPLPFQLEASTHPLAACLTAPKLTAYCQHEEVQSIQHLLPISADDIRTEWAIRSSLHTAILADKNYATTSDLIQSVDKMVLLKELKTHSRTLFNIKTKVIKNFCTATAGPLEELELALATQLKNFRIKLRQKTTARLFTPGARKALVGGNIFSPLLYDEAQIKITQHIVNSNQNFAQQVASVLKSSTRGTQRAPQDQYKTPRPASSRPYQHQKQTPFAPQRKPTRPLPVDHRPRPGPSHERSDRKPAYQPKQSNSTSKAPKTQYKKNFRGPKANK